MWSRRRRNASIDLEASDRRRRKELLGRAVRNARGQGAGQARSSWFTNQLRKLRLLTSGPRGDAAGASPSKGKTRARSGAVGTVVASITATSRSARSLAFFARSVIASGVKRARVLSSAQAAIAAGHSPVGANECARECSGPKRLRCPDGTDAVGQRSDRVGRHGCVESRASIARAHPRGVAPGTRPCTSKPSG